MYIHWFSCGKCLVSLKQQVPLFVSWLWQLVLATGTDQTLTLQALFENQTNG
jgi:hypothetical protein